MNHLSKLLFLLLIMLNDAILVGYSFHEFVHHSVLLSSWHGNTVLAPLLRFGFGILPLQILLDLTDQLLVVKVCGRRYHPLKVAGIPQVDVFHGSATMLSEGKLHRLSCLYLLEVHY